MTGSIGRKAARVKFSDSFRSLSFLFLLNYFFWVAIVREKTHKISGHELSSRSRSFYLGRVACSRLLAGDARRRGRGDENEG